MTMSQPTDLDSDPASDAAAASRRWYDADAAPYGGPGGHPGPGATGHAAPTRVDDPASLLALLPDAAIVADGGGRIVAANTHALGMFGFELDGHRVEDLVPDNMRLVHAAARRTFQDTGQARSMSAREGLTARRGDGTAFPVDVSLSPIMTPAGPAVLAIIVDTTLRMARVARLSLEAMTDVLTGLGNRAALTAALSARFERSAAEEPLVVLAIDLDGLREANRRLGHAGGDELLRNYASRLRANVRVGDTVIRSGGDEFIVLCAASIQTGRAIAERLTGPIPERRAVPASGLGVTASIGIAARRRRERPEGLLRRADAALMAAKAAGRNQVVLAS